MSKFAASDEHTSAVKRLIPGGAHTYAKGDDQYPAGMAPVIDRGAGCRVWDIDGNEFVEFGSGLRSTTLGHGFEPVVRAAQRQLAEGVNFVRPHRLEREAAERMIDLIPCAEMVKFGVNGSDATTAAVRLARAYTGRDMVAVAGSIRSSPPTTGSSSPPPCPRESRRQSGLLPCSSPTTT